MDPVQNTHSHKPGWINASYDQCRSNVTSLVQRVIEVVQKCFSAIIQLPLSICAFFNSFNHISASLSDSTPKSLSFRRCGDQSKLHHAAYHHKHYQLEQLLASKCAQDKDNRDRVTPLHAAAYKGNLQGVKLLMAAGGAIEARDAYGQTPMHWAAYKGHVAVINLLFILGADIDARDAQNYTPLHVAVKNGYLDAASTLVALGGDMEAKDFKKQTPYFIARLHGHLEIAQYLADVGAKTKVINREGRSAIDVTGRACLKAYIRQLKPFGHHELNSTSRRNLLDKVVMIA